MKRALFWAARDELRSLRAYAARTGEDLRAMIDMPPDVRARIERWCELHPRDAAEILEALEVRDLMLELL